MFNLAEYIAYFAFEMNKRWCELNKNMIPPYSWKDAPEEVKKRLINGVEFLLNNPDAVSETSHSNWLRFMIDNGWSYGVTKDEQAKTHPCIVPYDELPPEQKIKDTFFHSIVRFIEKSSNLPLDDFSIGKRVFFHDVENPEPAKEYLKEMFRLYGNENQQE